MSDLRLAQRHCTVALAAALDDNRAECYRLIFEAAKAAGIVIVPPAPPAVRDWNRRECMGELVAALTELRFAEDFPVTTIKTNATAIARAALSGAAEYAWPGA